MFSPAPQVATRAMEIAADMCVYTNHNFVTEVLDEAGDDGDDDDGGNEKKEDESKAKKGAKKGSAKKAKAK